MGMRIVVWAIAGILLQGCSISDSDRCPKGYEFLSDEKVCWEIQDGDTDESESDAGGETDPSDSGADDPDVGEDGFGKVCARNDDCDGAADYCLAMPDEEGICSYTGCDSGRECPAGNVCCNCTAFAYMGVVVCIPDEMTKPGGFIRSTCDCE